MLPVLCLVMSHQSGVLYFSSREVTQSCSFFITSALCQLLMRHVKTSVELFLMEKVEFEAEKRSVSDSKVFQSNPINI